MVTKLFLGYIYLTLGCLMNFLLVRTFISSMEVRKKQPQPSQNLPNLVSKLKSKGPLILGGLILYAGVVYVSYQLLSVRDSPEGIEVDEKMFDTREVWNKISPIYDKQVSSEERWMGLGLMRWWLIRKAKGDVLEVSGGTGRNFSSYLPSKMSSLTFTDRSSEILTEAKSKFKNYMSKFHNTFTSFQILDLASPNALISHQAKYDTVVDTFGLCSCPDPEYALIALARSCKNEKSKILLLEHGRSHYDWLNRILDMNSKAHAVRWGCWYNRDLIGILESENVRKVMLIESLQRWHFGTTLVVVARPKKNINDDEVL